MDREHYIYQMENIIVGISSKINQMEKAHTSEQKGRAWMGCGSLGN